MDQTLKLLIQLKRMQMTPRQKKRSLTMPSPRTLYPVAIEQIYAEEITKLQKKLVTYVLGQLETILPKLFPIRSTRKDADDPSTYEEKVKLFKEELNLMYGTAYISISDFARMLDKTAEKVFGFTESQWLKQVLAVSGTPYNPSASWWPSVKEAWAKTNYQLIKSLSEEYITKFNTTILNAIQSGWTYEETVEQIMKLSDKITGSRAKLLARDQIAKLNMQITKGIHTSAGINTYKWNTARDERVRGNPTGRYPKAIPDHWIMEGVICDWRNSTIMSKDYGQTWINRTANMPLVHPGMAYLCRCQASPYFVPEIQAIDSEGGV